MHKMFGGIIKYSMWIIIILSMFIVFFFQILSFDGSIEGLLTDVKSVISVLLTVMLNVMMVSAAMDSAVDRGINSEEFNLADKINNELIIKFNNNKKEIRQYVRDINKNELKSMQEDFLFKHGDVEYDDLPKKLKRKYNKLKPIVHNIYGFNLSLIYEMERGNEVTYKSSINLTKGKRWQQIKRVFSGLLYGMMTVNIMVSVDNVGAAFTTLFIITSGLALTFIMVYVPQYIKLTNTIPKKVLQKKTLFDGFEEAKANNTLNVTDTTDI